MLFCPALTERPPPTHTYTHQDPRWGRLQETPGECPILSSTYAAIFVSNVQRTGHARAAQASTDTYIRASSCCKHLAAYSEENWGGVDRYHFDSLVSPQEWTDTYEPAFQACAVEANASGLMCSCECLGAVYPSPARLAQQ